MRAAGRIRGRTLEGTGKNVLQSRLACLCPKPRVGERKAFFHYGRTCISDLKKKIPRKSSTSRWSRPLTYCSGAQLKFSGQPYLRFRFLSSHELGRPAVNSVSESLRAGRLCGLLRVRRPGRHGGPLARVTAGPQCTARSFTPEVLSRYIICSCYERA